jgi:AcrR family transcriptional regulator
MPAAVGKQPLPREVVEEHQRDRILAAATGVFAGRGYTATTVERIVEAAQIGVGTFYRIFASREECFLVLFDRIVEQSRERIARAAEAEEGWADRVLAGLGELLRLVAEEPDRARIVIVEAPTAGAAAERRHAGLVAELSAALRAGRAARSRGPAPPASFEDAAVAGLEWTIHQSLVAEEPIAVERLLPEMAGFIVEPLAAAAK